jgi:hypothetical protein
MLMFCFYEQSSNNKKASIYIRSQYAMLGPCQAVHKKSVAL